MGILTAYIHHPVFIWMSYFCVTGNGYFVHARPFCNAFLALYVIEVPIFFLSLGSIFPSLRTDIGFGVTFFLLRICLHAYMVCVFVHYVIRCISLFNQLLCFILSQASLAYYSDVDSPIMVLYLLTLCLHLFWFTNWFSKYGKKEKKKARKQN